MLPRQLELFLCAYERRSLRTAAQVLHLTQPALTKSLRLLEESLGIVLFERRATGVVPTAHAETLARYARTTVNAWRLAQAEMATARDGLVGELRLGAGSIWSLRAIPQAMVRFHRQYPGIQLSLETDVADYLVPKLIEGEIDLFIGSVEGLASDDDIAVQVLQSSHMGAFVRGQHPLARAPRVAPADLLGFSWVTHTHDVKGLDALRNFFRAQALEPPGIALRFSSLAAMENAIQVDDCIAFVSDDFAAEAPARGIVPLRLRRDIWSFSTGIAYRRPLGVLAHVQHLIELIKPGMGGKSPKPRR
jgi:DNA-binding transcriptional LysR family regulator